MTGVQTCALPISAGRPVLDLTPFRRRARGPLWLEISPNPSAIPAAACVVRDSAPQRWQLPEDVWQHLAPGPYLLQVVDDAGRELGGYRFARSTREPAPDDGEHCGSAVIASRS